MENKEKIFVLDTNVVLHDYRCIYHFEEHDIVIPIVVLEELDKFKKGNNQINFQAREFMRELDKLSGEALFHEGVELGEGKGRLYIETGKAFSEELAESFTEHNADNRILAITEFVKNTHPEKQTILVSKDINLRLKAKSLGLLAQDYQTGKVRSLKKIQEGIKTYDDVDPALIARLYKSTEGIPVEEFEFGEEIMPNQYFILKSEKSSALAHYNPFERTVSRVEKEKAAGIVPRNAEQTFALDALLRPEIKLVSLTGKAGTGKTLLALAAALQQRKNYEQIYLARPIVALADKDLGYLPGSAKEKVGPYMQPLFDNLNFIKNRYGKNSKNYARIDEMVEEEKLIITPYHTFEEEACLMCFLLLTKHKILLHTR